MRGPRLALGSCLCLTQEAQISAASPLFPFLLMPISHLSIHKEIAVSVQNGAIIKEALKQEFLGVYACFTLTSSYYSLCQFAH